MALMVPKQSVTVVRPNESTGKNQRVTPPIDKAFNFTDDEIAYLRKTSPEALRKPVNESPAEGNLADDFDIDMSGLDANRDGEVDTESAPKAEGAKAGGKGKQAGGKTGKTVNPADTAPAAATPPVAPTDDL